MIGANRLDNDVVTNTDWNRDVVQEGNYVQEVLAGTNADKIAPGSISGVVGYYPNALVNGGWEIWQRGNGPYTTNNVVTADAWKSAISLSSYSLSRGAALATGSQFDGVVAYTHVASGFLQLFQVVENFAEYKGRTVTLTVSFSSSVAGTVFAQVSDGVGAANTSRNTLTGTVQTFSATLAVSTSASTLTISFLVDTASCTAHFDNAMLCVAPSSIPYVPRTVAEEYLLCRRRYMKLKAGTRWRSTIASEVTEQGIYFPQPMSVAPTVTIAAGTRANIASGTTADVDTGGCRLIYTATSGTTDTFAINDVLTLDTAT